MKIAYNPKTAAALTTAPANNDITFDLRGLNIFVRGEKFKGTDTTYSVFKKHTSAGSGGYNGLVPVPSYTATNVRFLREDGTWSIPAATSFIYTQLTNQDLDDYLDEGKWYYAGGGNRVTHKPSGVDAFELYVGRNANGYRYQKLITSNGIIWFRYYDSTAWKTWVRWYTDQNTDQKVLQSATTTANFRPVILGYTNTNTPSGLSANVTQQVYTTTTIYAQPSTGSLWANKLYSGGKPVLTEHQSLANYVTLNTAQTITGTKTFGSNIQFNGTQSIHWNNGTYQQRISITDDSTANTSVFNFQQSTNTGSSWSTLASIYDNGYIYANGFRKNGSSNQKVLLGDGSDKNLSDFSMAHSHPYLQLQTISGTIDVNTLKGTRLYYTTSDGGSQNLVNSPFTNTFSMIQVANLINGNTDWRRSIIAFNPYGDMKIFNDRGTSGDGGVWYTVLTSGNYSSIADSRYVNITGDIMTGTLTTRARIYAQLSNRTDKVGLFQSSTSNKGGLVLIDTSGTEHVLYLSTSNLEWKGRKVWDTGNDGHGSGLDADLLDGKHASSFMLKTDELSNNLTTITKSLNVTQAWMDTGITSTNLPANGTYIVQVQVNANDGTGNMWNCYSSGVMSWYKDGTNDTETDEIILHRSGHAYGKTIYLRTVMQSSGVLKLQIGASSGIGKAYTYTFKFKRII